MEGIMQDMPALLFLTLLLLFLSIDAEDNLKKQLTIAGETYLKIILSYNWTEKQKQYSTTIGFVSDTNTNIQGCSK